MTRGSFTRIKVNDVDCPWGWPAGREHWKDSICPRLTWPLGGSTDRTGGGGSAGEGLGTASVDTIKDNRIKYKLNNMSVSNVVFFCLSGTITLKNRSTQFESTCNGVILRLKL